MSRLLLPIFLLVSLPAGAADRVTFGTRVAVPGDSIEQAVRFDMWLQTTSRRGAEILDESSTQIERQQERLVTAIDVRGKRVVEAEVTFHTSSANHNGEASIEPVAGKSYRCTRDGERLEVLTLEGGLPPMEEYALVARAMDSLGTESPLSQFLAGRTVRVGERLTLPAEVAQRALGFDREVGVVEAFQLKLKEIQPTQGRNVANFAAQIEAVGGGTQQMRLIVEGTFRVDETSCRIVSADLSGPIAMSGLRGAGGSGYRLDGRGRMRLELSARYRDAVR